METSDILAKLPENLIGSTYRFLEIGDVLKTGDYAYTWINPECTEVGWLKLENAYPEPYTDGMVPVLRVMAMIHKVRLYCDKEGIEKVKALESCVKVTDDTSEDDTYIVIGHPSIMEDIEKTLGQNDTTEEIK